MRFPALVAIAFALAAAPAAADESPTWGAIAYDRAFRGAGTAVDYPTPDAARRAAVDACPGQCTETMIFQRNCGAVAASADGATGWARNRWRGRAIARALGTCGDGGADCSLVAWACTRH